MKRGVLASSATLLVVAALGGVIVAPAGAAPARPKDQAGAPTSVSGEVYAGGNVVGAKVSVVDANSKPLADGPKTRTLAGGAFSLSVRDLPADFRLIARGGRVDGEAFKGVLVADVHQFDPEPAALVSVNLGTTLVAAYLDAHPRAELDRAEAVVAKFLGLQSSDDIAVTTSLSNAEFDQARFLAAARRHGGLKSFLADLVDEMDAGKQRAFEARVDVPRAGPAREPAAVSDDPVRAKVGADPSPTDIAAFLFESLRESANRPECLKTPPAESCKDIPFGDVLRFFTSPTEKALAEITAKLDMVLVALTKLQDTADTIVARLDQATYDAIVGYMNPDAINRAMKTFKEVTENCAKTQESMFCKNQLGDSTVDKPGQLRLAIQNTLINSGVIDGVWKRVSGRTLGQTTSGVLDVLPAVVNMDAARKPRSFFTKDQSKALLATLDYYYDIEMTAITLATNYWRWEGRAEKDILVDVNTFDSQVKAQQKVFSPLPEGTVLDLRSGLMWATSVFCSTYSSFGPRETGQCPAKYAGFPITDQRLMFPGYPYLPYFTSCTAGAWCMGTEGAIDNLVQGATAPWGAWLRAQSGITFNGQGDYDTWLVNVDCKPWYSKDGRPICGTVRRYVNWAESDVQWSATRDRNAAWYLFVRQPTEASRYH